MEKTRKMLNFFGSHFSEKTLCFNQIPYYLGNLDTNYIIFRNVENFKKFLQRTKKIVWRKTLNLEEYSLSIEMKILKNN
jgi:hypothetical protein